MTIPERFFSNPLDWLHQSKWFGMKMDLDNISLLMERLDSPHRKLKVIHVAGTNGKGSTCAMIYSILREAGFSAGLYTSPHLVSERERIEVNGEWISEEDFIQEMGRLQEIVEDENKKNLLKPTYFELMTAAAIHYFWRRKVDFVVLETGMGGRLDSTNIVNSQIQVITNIDLDHTQYLGKTIVEIAREKAGIIKSGSVVLTGASGEALEVIRENCCRLNVPCLEYPGHIQARLLERNLAAQKISVQTSRNIYTFHLPLLGEYQLANAGLAAGAIEALSEQGLQIDKRTLEKGMEKTKWPGRFQIISKNPVIVLDAAHNPAGVQALFKTWKSYFGSQKAHVIFGALTDKDYRGMIASLAPLASRVSLIQIQSSRAADVNDLRKIWMEYVGEGKIEIISVQDLLTSLADKSKNSEYVLVSGSIYLLGQFMEELQKSGMFKIVS